MTVLFPVHKLPLEKCAIWPFLTSLPVLIISVEFTNVSAAICVDVDALTTSLAVTPETLVAVAVSMDQSARTTCQPILPKAFIAAAIGPQLRTSAHSHSVLVFHPLSFVKNTVFYLHYGTLY